MIEQLTNPTKRLVSIPDLRTMLAKGPEDDAALGRAIESASRIVEQQLRRPLARMQVTETMRGNGRRTIRVSRRPVVELGTVTYAGSALTAGAVEIADSERGILRYVGSEFDNEEAYDWAFTYTAGYLVADDDVLKSTAIAADGGAETIAGAGFPALLVGGDYFSASGFADSTLNVTYKVSSATAPTTSLITCTAVAATEAAGAEVSLEFDSLPEDMRFATLTLSKDLFLQRNEATYVTRTTSDNSSVELDYKRSIMRVRDLLGAWLPSRVTSIEMVRS